ncbi:hypothetical protein M9Y82_19195, partial [Leptospira weilii]|nr:hypothetical protein [Leptospira weilii]
IEELKSKGLSKEQATAILDAQAHAESKAAQEKNNQESGKSVLDGAAISTQRREGEDGSHGVIGFGDDDGPTPAHGAPSSHDPGQTLASSGSFDPDGKPTGGEDRGATISNNKDKISLGNMDVKINKGQEGESFFKTKPKGLQGSETDKVFTNMHDPNQKLDKINWDYSKDNSMHNSKQKGQADLYAKEGTPLSVIHSQDGKFQLMKIENRGEMGGNSALVQFKDTNGETRQIRFNHLQDSFPSYVKDHFKARDAGPLEMQNGTVFGRVGTTGNTWVGNVIKQSGITGPNSHTHIVLYDKPKTNYEGTSVPSWLKPAIGFDGNIKNGAK